MMIEFAVNQLAGAKIPNNYWRKWLKNIEKVLRLKKKSQLSIAVVSASTIKKLNRQYRGKDQVTDVLSFADRDVAPYQSKAFAAQNLGEVIICYSQAKKQAKKHSQTLIEELELLFVHGTLHLLGYDHQKAKAAKIMENLEQKILDQRL